MSSPALVQSVPARHQSQGPAVEVNCWFWSSKSFRAIMVNLALPLSRRHPLPKRGCPRPASSEIIFPTAVPDPQYELICIQPIRDDFYFFPPEPMIWIFMTCVFGIRVRMCVDLLFHCGEEIKSLHTTKFTCNEWRPPTAIQILYCALIQRDWGPCHWSWTITLVRGKLTLL